jgi:hypothetical protein
MTLFTRQHIERAKNNGDFDRDLYQDEHLRAQHLAALDQIRIDQNNIIYFGGFRAEPAYGGAQGYRIFKGQECQYQFQPESLEDLVNNHLSLLLFSEDEIENDLAAQNADLQQRVDASKELGLKMVIAQIRKTHHIEPEKFPDPEV